MEQPKQNTYENRIRYIQTPDHKKFKPNYKLRRNNNKQTTMSRRSAAPKALPPNLSSGFASLIVGNEEAIAQMLGEKSTSDLLVALQKVMTVNNLSPEQLLGSYFSASLLSKYAEKIGKSGKGSAATLAARISQVWCKPGFLFPPDVTGTKGGQAAAAGGIPPPKADSATENKVHGDDSEKGVEDTKATSADADDKPPPSKIRKLENK